MAIYELDNGDIVNERLFSDKYEAINYSNNNGGNVVGPYFDTKGKTFYKVVWLERR